MREDDGARRGVDGVHGRAIASVRAVDDDASLVAPLHELQPEIAEPAIRSLGGGHPPTTLIKKLNVPAKGKEPDEK